MIATQEAGLIRCGKCHCYKGPEDYNACRSRSNGLQSYCKPCHRAAEGDPRKPGGPQIRALRTAFLAAQDGRCAMPGCDAHLDPAVRWDLDHVPGYSRADVFSLRGVVCHRCNMRIGAHERGSRLCPDVAAYLAAYQGRLARFLANPGRYATPIEGMLPRPTEAV